MPTASCNGVELYYEEHGEGEPALLCVMGMAADHRAWVLNLPAFSDRMRTVVFDNRDVGRSSYVPDPYSIADLAADTLALADQLGLQRFHLLGVSMGGTIAQELALEAPRRVLTLTLAVSWAWGGAWWRARGRMLFGRGATSAEELADQLLVLNLSEELWEDAETLERARRLMLDNPNPQRPDGLMRQAMASARHDARDRLGALTMPVHVIGAEYDYLVPVWKSHQLAELIPGAKLTEIPRAPHAVNTERAAEFNEAVLGFIDEHV